MIVIICVDDNLGMMFNNRRQSQDRTLRKRIIEISVNSRLLMNSYSIKQFDEEDRDKIITDEDFAKNAQKGDFVFFENISPKQYEKNIEKIILYHWNRNYPADFYFDIDLKESGWILNDSYDFEGYSHEKITEEIYVK